jgi:hypothetical protein
VHWSVPDGQRIAYFDRCPTSSFFFPDSKSLAILHGETFEIWDMPPRRPWWIECGLPVLFALLLLLGCTAWRCQLRLPFGSIPTPPDRLDDRNAERQVGNQR